MDALCVRPFVALLYFLPVFFPAVLASGKRKKVGGEKTMSDKKRFLDKDFTRRQFLKLSGKSLAGVAMSSTMMSTLGITAAALAEDKVRVWAFPQGLLVVNPDRCVGCHYYYNDILWENFVNIFYFWI